MPKITSRFPGFYRSPPAPVRGAVFALAIALLGVAVTVMSWVRVEEERREQALVGISGLAEESGAAIQRRVEQHLGALRNLARFWQFHGLLTEEAWQFDTRMLVQHFQGVNWVTWVDRFGTDIRYVGPDTSWRPSPELLADARTHLDNPGNEFRYSGNGDLAVRVYVPVRTPEDSVGVLAAGIHSDSLLGGPRFETARGLSYTVRNENGEVIFQRGQSDPRAPPWLTAKSSIRLPTGGSWLVEYRPTEEYVTLSDSPWPDYFLFVGSLLSVALGAIAFQFFRLREFSSALERTNRALDLQVHELSDRDRSLRRLNEELEERVDLRTAELSEALRELEAFSHSVSHDLRSPIGAVINFASIIEEDYGDRLDEEGRRLLRRIRTGGESAIGLLNELVLFAGAGREDVETRRIDVTEVARRASNEAIAGDGEASNVSIEIEELPPAHADPILIERVFANLFSNALKYTRERENRRIRVTGTTGDHESVYEVADNGIGFDPEVGERLFEPFQRLHSAREFQGTGLGLAIVSKIVRRQGGRVWAESDGSSGAKFCFTLPNEEAIG